MRGGTSYAGARTGPEPTREQLIRRPVAVIHPEPAARGIGRDAGRVHAFRKRYRRADVSFQLDPVDDRACRDPDRVADLRRLERSAVQSERLLRRAGLRVELGECRALLVHQPERRPSRRLDLDEVPRLLREVERLAGARPRVVAQHLVVEALADPLVPAGWKQNLRLLRAGREPARELVSGRVDPVERAVALQRPDRIVADGDRAALG